MGGTLVQDITKSVVDGLMTLKNLHLEIACSIHLEKRTCTLAQNTTRNISNVHHRKVRVKTR